MMIFMMKNFFFILKPHNNDDVKVAGKSIDFWVRDGR